MANSRTLRIFEALKKTSPKAAFAYLEGSAIREVIDKDAEFYLGDKHEGKTKG